MSLILPRAGFLSGRFRLEIFLNEEDAPFDPERLMDLLRDIGGLLANGGVPSPGMSGRPRMTVERIGTDRNLTFADLALEEADRRFGRIVQSAFSARGSGLADIRIVDRAAPKSDGETVPDPDDVLDGTFYPERVEKNLFEYNFDDSLDTRMRRLVVTFPHPLSRDDLHRLGDWLAPWGAVLEAGGFVLPNDAPEETLNTYAGVQLFERDSAEIVIDRFESSEEAFDILLNMLDAYSARVDRISLVEQF